LTDEDAKTGFWFASDSEYIFAEKMERISEGWKGTPPPDSTVTASWYTKFSKVASSTMREIIYLRLGYQTTGGKVATYTSDAGTQILMRVPTEPWTTDDGSGSIYREFPIHDYNLAEWVSHIKDFTVPGVQNPPRSEDPEQADIDAQHSRIQDGSEDVLDTNILNFSVKSGVDEDRQDRARLAEAMELAGLEKLEYLETDFINAAYFPPAPVRDPEWTPWLASMAVSNVYGQLELMYQRVASVQQGIALLTLFCEQRKARLEGQKAALIEKVRACRKAMAVLNKVHQETQTITKEIHGFNEEINSAMAYPTVRKYLNMSRPSISLSGTRSGPTGMSQNLSYMAFH
jgi:hypothetical protein